MRDYTFFLRALDRHNRLFTFSYFAATSQPLLQQGGRDTPACVQDVHQDARAAVSYIPGRPADYQPGVELFEQGEWLISLPNDI
jgi:hypothetical protein